jgi:muramoyltetrapeptide carboxypeptidase
MISPKYLAKGDKVGLVAPARSVLKNELENAIQFLKSFGLDAITGENIIKIDHQFAGSDAERASDMQKFLDDENIQALFCVRGGYGSVRTLQLLNFDKFIKNPKWIVGYSDITVFHSYLNSRLGIETLHAPLISNVGKKEHDQEAFIKTIETLFGKPLSYSFDANPLNSDGRAKGRLVGGNLSVLFSLRGTPADVDTQKKILFIEDLDEYLYHIDRMMMNLKYGNKLSGLRGVIVGEMKDMKDNMVPFGSDALQIISNILSEFNIPVCFGFPAGHGFKNWPLILGREVVLNIGKKCSLDFK